MQEDPFACSNQLLPLKDTIVWAQEPFWRSFPPELLDRRIVVAEDFEELAKADQTLNLAIVVSDDSDLQINANELWANELVREFIVVFPDPRTHAIHLKNLSQNQELSNQLEHFDRHGDLLAVKCVKDIATEWSVDKLLRALHILSGVEEEEELGIVRDAELQDEITSHLRTFDQLIELTATNNPEVPTLESITLDQLREQNERLQSNNASLRLQVDTLERKYNSLANSRLGKMTLKRWGRK